IRRATHQAAHILNRVKKQYNKEPIKTYNKSSFNRGSNTFSGSSISRILDHAETATTATNNFRLKGRRSFNSRATTIEEITELLALTPQF
ncbi:relaxase, partial [Klebsiella pneumoniae]